MELEMPKENKDIISHVFYGLFHQTWGMSCDSSSCCFSSTMAIL